MITVRSELKRCPQCEYDIHLGVPNDRCPECGLRLDDVTYVFRASKSIRHMVRTSLLPIVLVFLLFPPAVGFVGLLVSLNVWLIVVQAAMLVIGAFFITRWAQTWRNAPLLMTSREGLTIGPVKQMRFFAWDAIKIFGVRDWPRQLTTEASEVVDISQCFDGLEEVQAFEAMYHRLRAAQAEGGTAESRGILCDACRQLANPAPLPRRAFMTRRTGLALLYIAAISACGLITAEWNETVGAGIFFVLAWAGIIYALVCNWKSDGAKKEGTP